MIKIKKSVWTTKTKDLTKELHKEICLNNYNWHKFRSNKNRRCAELIVSAMSQVINDGEDSEIENLLLQAIRWIKEEVKDEGCSNH